MYEKMHDIYRRMFLKTCYVDHISLDIGFCPIQFLNFMYALNICCRRHTLAFLLPAIINYIRTLHLKIEVLGSKWVCGSVVAHNVFYWMPYHRAIIKFKDINCNYENHLIRESSEGVFHSPGTFDGMVAA